MYNSGNRTVHVIFIISILGLLLYSSKINANEPEEVGLFSNIGENFIHSLSGYNAIFHLSAIAATSLLVHSRTDANLDNYFASHPSFGTWFNPVIYTGGGGNAMLGGILFVIGELNDDKEAVYSGYAVLQAGILAISYTTVLKFITGRPIPSPYYKLDKDDKSNDDNSEIWNFGFGKNGAYNGWPSGHTTSTISALSALEAFYPNKTWLKIVGFGYALYTVVGVTAVRGGKFHWFSDGVAAALMSYTLGHTVGQFYRNAYDGTLPEKHHVQFMPYFDGKTIGACASLAF